MWIRFLKEMSSRFSSQVSKSRIVGILTTKSPHITAVECSWRGETLISFTLWIKLLFELVCWWTKCFNKNSHETPQFLSQKTFPSDYYCWMIPAAGRADNLPLLLFMVSKARLFYACVKRLHSPGISGHYVSQFLPNGVFGTRARTWWARHI